MLVYTLVLCGTAVVAMYLTALARSFATRRGLLDVPNARSSHTTPIPRMGGVAIMIAALAAWLVGWFIPGTEIGMGFAVLAVGSVGAGLLGLVDDVFLLGPTGKLVGQFLIALPAVLLLPMTVYGWPLWLTSAGAVIWILTYTNMFNFMDGSDGLAAGVTVLVSMFLAILAFGVGNAELVWFALALAATSAGFLRYNSAPATVFMGDAGSFFLGYALAVLALLCIKAGVRPVAVLMLMHPFVLDALLTLGIRIWRREKFWQAHRQHYYQRLLIAGCSHESVARRYYVWQGVAALCSLAYEYGAERERFVAISIALGIAGLHLALVYLLERRAAVELSLPSAESIQPPGDLAG